MLITCWQQYKMARWKYMSPNLTNMLKLLVACVIFINLSRAFALDVEAKPFLDVRIIGGGEADIFDYPYLASIEYLNRHRCGGAIIGRTWILTAAHCVDGSPNPEDFDVRLGTPYLGIGGQLRNVSTLIPHANYSNVTFDFDIALLQLDEPIKLSRTAQIIALADNGDAIVEGSLARVSGWGSTTEGGKASSILRSVEVPIVIQSVCDDMYSYHGGVTENMLCAGLWEGAVNNACGGDGGGPLVSESRVIGIVSWGLGCARPYYPEVYANVGVLRDWITEQTGI